MRALLLKGLSSYEATTLFIDEIAEAFRGRGVEARIVDLGPSGDELAYLAEAVAGERFDLVFSIGLFAELRDAHGRDVSQVVGAPFVVQYVDYPLSHFGKLNRTARSTALLVVDPTHVEAVRSVYGADYFRHVAFSPHGAVGRPHRVEADPESFVAARPTPILFPGTFYKPGEPPWAGQDAPTRKLFDIAVEIALAEAFMPALQAFDIAMERHGGHLREPIRSQFRVNAFAVHERVRQQRRFDMLKAAARAGLPIEVVGAGYDRDLYRFRNIRHLGQRSLREVTQMMAASRVVLNVNANFGQGSHERPLSAMVAGAVAASDHSGFYDEAFGPEDLVQLRWKSLDADLAALAGLLERPEALHAIALGGQARAVARHLWYQRIDAILDAARAAAAA